MAIRTPILGALAIASACALLPAAAPAAASSCAGAETETADQMTATVEQSVLCLINQRRAEAGIGPVRLNPKLGQAAARHSNDMVRTGFFAHTSPEGATFIDRIATTGYMRGARSWLVGENLVWGSGGLSTPASMVKAWMKSPPHRANLLRGRFREIGLSAARGTPSSAADENGVTVSSEYGYRDMGKDPKKDVKKKRARRAARRARSSAGGGPRDVQVDRLGEPLQPDLADRLEAQMLGVHRVDHAIG